MPKVEYPTPLPERVWTEELGEIISDLSDLEGDLDAEDDNVREAEEELEVAEDDLNEAQATYNSQLAEVVSARQSAYDTALKMLQKTELLRQHLLDAGVQLPTPKVKAAAVVPSPPKESEETLISSDPTEFLDR